MEEQSILLNFPKKNEKDTILFMTAFNVNEYKKNFFLFRGKDNIEQLLSKYHISSFLVKDIIHTRESKFKLASEFDVYKQTTNFKAEVLNKKGITDNCYESLGKMSLLIALKHSEKLLLDTTCFEISFIFDMESFLIKIEKGIYQINPVVFCLNQMFFVVYEVINYETGECVGNDEIWGSHNNFNIIPVNEAMYFDEQKFIKEARRIPEIVYKNITDFIETLTKNKFQIEEFSFVHNILVISNFIKDVEEYFEKVLGVEEMKFELQNLNTTDAFQYYSQEYLGVVTAISENQFEQGLFDCVILEAMKMYICLKLIVGFDITKKLQDTLDNQLYVQRLFFPGKVPIITWNVLDNIKKTHSFKNYKEAIDFKISYLKLLQERKRSQNALFLNILLYLLALISGIGTLQVLQTEFGWSFKATFVILILVFLGLGIYWIFRECNRKP